MDKHDEVYKEMLINSEKKQKEVEFGIYLIDEILKEIIRNPSKEKFNLFVEWVNTVSTVDNMKETGTVFGEYLAEIGITVKEHIGAYGSELKKLIPKGDLDIYGVDSTISPSITQPINREVLSTPPIKHSYNMVDKSILDHNYPKIESHRELAPLTIHLFDTLKPENTEGPKNHYLERPSVVLPGTHGFKDFPEDTFQHNRHFENMIGQLRDNMSSMDDSMGSFADRYSLPSMPDIPEFSYSGYSSGESFSFN